jgi:hypothetical protein
MSTISTSSGTCFVAPFPEFATMISLPPSVVKDSEIPAPSPLACAPYPAAENAPETEKEKKLIPNRLNVHNLIVFMPLHSPGPKVITDAKLKEIRLKNLEKICTGSKLPTQKVEEKIE